MNQKRTAFPLVHHANMVIQWTTQMTSADRRMGLIHEFNGKLTLEVILFDQAIDIQMQQPILSFPARERAAKVSIENFFDADFCDRSIKHVEKGFWKESNYGRRKIQTAELDQSWLEEKLRQHVPQRILDWEYFGIHKDTCQYFKYTENDTFPDHQDQAIHWSPDVQSLLTLVVYLNRCQGGATGFPERQQSITPASGKAVIFPQNLLHNSARIESGLKYILRAQILYKNPGTFPY